MLRKCEELHEFERSSALAIWHEDLGAAVKNLERGSLYYRDHGEKAYAEIMELVALAIAGFRGEDNGPSADIWRRTCSRLLEKSELSAVSSSKRPAYVKAALEFLMAVGSESCHLKILERKDLSLCDRVGFACRFLSIEDAVSFMRRSLADCKKTGNIEAITISGLGKEGIRAIQSYVDRTADAQTAALITSRVILPSDWIRERQICGEWLSSYRMLLNRWQLWQVRATFDVDRADYLRKVKSRLMENSTKSQNKGGRRPLSTTRRNARQLDPDIQASVPAQMDARCNYCSSSLSLSKQKDTHSKTWLSKMKPVLPCCAQCRKPLPRCSVCSLSLGTLNPYAELGKERPSSPGKASAALGNVAFAEWFTWCLSCRHGGHAQHMIEWFGKHQVCPVSGCDCRCQFNGKTNF